MPDEVNLSGTSFFIFFLLDFLKNHDTIWHEEGTSEAGRSPDAVLRSRTKTTQSNCMVCFANHAIMLKIERVIQREMDTDEKDDFK